MKYLKLIFFGVLLFFSNSCTNSEKKDSLIQKVDYSTQIQILWQRLTYLSVRMDSVLADEQAYVNSEDGGEILGVISDSLENINKRIVYTFVQNSASYSEQDIAEIKKKTEIRVVNSEDKKITFFSWNTGEFSKIPFYNNVLFFNDGSSIRGLHYSKMDTSDKIMGNNLTIDTVLESRINNRKLYLIVKSNVLRAPAFIYSSLTSLRINGDKLITEDCIFQKGDSCYSTLSFTYYLNTNIQTPLKFEYNSKENKVFTPKLDETYSNVIGKLSYRINE